GVKFPEAELHGVDLVVCDYSYLTERLDSLLGIVFTHGHEDHIGGLPYLIMQLDPHDPIPIYGTPLTLGLISVKLREHGMLGRVEQAGWTASEASVRQALEELIESAPGRVLVTTFASNIGRLREVVKSAYKLGRRSAVVGRSMEENLRVARELGFMDIPDGSLLELRETNELPPEKIVLLSTGSQGEPTSVLSRIARGDHPLVKIQPNDTVIFSASPVPGNEESVARSIDNLFRRGARVVYQTIDPRVHVSGHASREELKHMLELVRPTYLVPLHGEHRMLWLFRELAVDCGIPREHV